MTRLLPLERLAGMLHWGRLIGDWGSTECRELRGLLRDTVFTPGSSLVLDFSETRHFHYKAVPLLLAIGQGIEARNVSFRVTGISDYLKSIVEVACAQEGRDFIETHLWVHAPLLGHAGFEPVQAVPAPHGLVVPSLN